MQQLRWQYTLKNDRMYHMFRRLLADCKLSTGYLKEAGYIQKMLGTQPNNPGMPQVMSARKEFDIELYFHAAMNLHEPMRPSCCVPCKILAVVCYWYVTAIRRSD